MRLSAHIVDRQVGQLLPWRRWMRVVLFNIPDSTVFNGRSSLTMAVHHFIVGNADSSSVALTNRFVEEVRQVKRVMQVALSMCTAFGAMVSCAVAAEEAALDGAQLYQMRACSSCHGADGKTPIMPLYPAIAGQNADYIFNQMKDIKSGARSNGQAVIMMGIMVMVTEEEMRAIADWVATQ